MFGIGDHPKQIDDGTLPIFVHSLQSVEAFELAGKVWTANVRTVRADAANQKEFIHLSFSNPACSVWLQRDIGRTDTYELILLWSEAAQGVTEVYVISVFAGAAVGNDARAKELLQTMLTAPSTVPVSSVK